ncbi:MAG TPA: hypothetical protein VGP47_04435 [Parachlamydiaceae bacterium]|nr:hypothetical protein [Parachlamydiaceae bacterium]
MKKISLAVFCFSAAATTSCFAEEPVCHHCEDIREYNAEHHQNFEYYDQYLKSNNPAKDNNFDKAQSGTTNKNAVNQTTTVKPSPNVTKINSVRPNAAR